MSVIKKITDSSGHITPFINTSALKSSEVFIDNVEGVDDLIYGPRKIHGVRSPHDHGQEGGESWPEIINLSFARTNAAADFGIPYIEQSVDQTLQDIITGVTEVRPGMKAYKRSAVAPVLLRAGWRAVDIRVIVRASNDDSSPLYLFTLSHFDLSQSLIPANLDGWPIALVTQTTFDSTAIVGSFAFFSSVVSLSQSEIDKLGDFRYDRLVELRVWQYSLTYAGFAANLCSLQVYPTSVSDEMRHALERDRAQANVSGIDLKKGAITPQLTARMKQVTNQQAVGLLGRAPGLASDGKTPDRRTSFTQDIFYPHQHQGTLVPDGQGGFFSDGADLRLSDYGVYMAQPQPDANPTKGIRLQPNADQGSTWLRVRRRISVSAGCAATDMTFALNWGSGEKRARCNVYVAIVPIGGGSSMVTAMESGKHRASAGSNSGTIYTESDGVVMVFCEVDPLDHPAYQKNKHRELAGFAGHWTGAALVPDDLLPPVYDGLQTGDSIGRLPSPYRISQPVRIYLTHPARNADETPHATQDYMLYLRFEVVLPDVPSYDDEARLLWWHLRPAPEYQLETR